MIGIVKGGKHSYDDFGLTVRDATTETKKKNKTLVKIPFMNGSYDFSSLYGGQTYEEETRTYEFNLVAKDKYDLEIQKIKVSDWLLDGEQGPELVNMPRGASVTPAHKTEQLLNTPNATPQQVSIVVQTMLDGKVLAETVTPYTDIVSGNRLNLSKRGVLV